MHLKTSSAKRRPFCLALNVLRISITLADTKPQLNTTDHQPSSYILGYTVKDSSNFSIQYTRFDQFEKSSLVCPAESVPLVHNPPPH